MPIFIHKYSLSKDLKQLYIYNSYDLRHSIVEEILENIVIVEEAREVCHQTLYL